MLYEILLSPDLASGSAGFLGGLNKGVITQLTVKIGPGLLKDASVPVVPHRIPLPQAVFFLIIGRYVLCQQVTHRTSLSFYAAAEGCPVGTRKHSPTDVRGDMPQCPQGKALKGCSVFA